MSQASENRLRSVDLMARLGGIIDVAVHWGRKSSHHCISARASLFRVMWWCMRLTVVLKSINLLENIRPGLTTLDMWLSLPIRDFSSRFVHVLRFFHLFKLVVASASFSLGTSMVIVTELIMMPRYFNKVQGPSILSSARGMSRSLKALIMVLSWVVAMSIIFPRTAKKSSE